MSQKIITIHAKRYFIIFFFDLCYYLFARNSNLKTQSNWYRKSYKVTNDTLYTYIQLLNWEFMSKKKIERKKYDGKNEKMN